jgi:hypothetical protein
MLACSRRCCTSFGWTPRCPSQKSWNTAPTRTDICSWSYAATSVVTAQPASADPTGTSSSTRAASVGSSTSAKPATQRAPWPPSGQSLWGSRSLPWPGSFTTGRVFSYPQLFWATPDVVAWLMLGAALGGAAGAAHVFAVAHRTTAGTRSGADSG